MRSVGADYAHAAALYPRLAAGIAVALYALAVAALGATDKPRPTA